MGKVSKYTWICDWLPYSKEYPVQFFIGNRGDGKTYGALDGAIENYERDGSKILFSRLTIKEQQQITASKTSEKGNPFKKINKKEDRHITIIPGGNNSLVSTITDFEIDDKNNLIMSGNIYGYACSLVDICDVRGQDFDDVDDWVIDEFIPEKHKRLPKGLGDAFLNGYETINRDREDEGRDPLRVWALANANDIYNPIFKELGLVSICEKMKRLGQKDFYIKDRGIAIHLLEDAEDLVEARSKRAIAKLAKGTNYEDMAFNNEFVYNDFSNVGFRKVVGMIPLVTFNGITIYSQKGSRKIYCSYAPAKCMSFDLTKDSELLLFKKRFGNKIYNSFVNQNIQFESYEIKARILEVIL